MKPPGAALGLAGIVAGALIAAFSVGVAMSRPEPDPPPAELRGEVLWAMEWWRDGPIFARAPKCRRVLFRSVYAAEEMAKLYPGTTTFVAILPLPDGAGALIRSKIVFGDGAPPIFHGYATTEAACLTNYTSFYEATAGF